MASFALRTETIFGSGCAAEVGPRAAQAGFGRALLVTDRGVRAAGLTARVETSLREARVAYDVFDDVSPNPRDVEAEACLAAIGAVDAKLLIAVGGGSTIDAAKAAGVLRTNGGRPRDWCPAVGGRTPPQPSLPLYALPTTTGTGSEVSGGAVITFDYEQPSTNNEHSRSERRISQGVRGWTGQGAAGGASARGGRGWGGRASKNGIGNCQPTLAFLDPDLVVDLPASVLVASGLDALSHATESYVSPQATLFTRAFSAQAIRTIARALPAAVAAARTPGADRRPSMEAMLYAANVAGRSMLGRTGQVHAISRAVGAYFDTVHGLTNAVLLPVVLAYHEPVLRDLLAEVAYLMGDPTGASGAPGAGSGDANVAVAAGRAIDGIARLRDAAGAPARLRDLGVARDALPRIAAEALLTDQSQNPRAATEADLLTICERAW